MKYQNRARSWTDGRFAIAAAISFVALLTAADASGQITQCVGGPGGGLCSSTDTLCTVLTMVDVVPGSFLDCSGKDVIIAAPNGGLRVTGGTLALSARNLHIQTARSIQAVEHPTRQVGIEIDVEQKVHVSGRVIARNAGGLSYVYITSGGLLELLDSQPAIDVSGTDESCDGGDVLLVSGGTINIQRKIYAFGKESGTEENVNSGGIVIISAATGLNLREEIRAHGRFYDGGYVELTSGKGINIDWTAGTNGWKGEIDVEGRNLDGYGGTVDMLANDGIDMSGPIRGGSGINHAGGYGRGAYVGMRAGCQGIVIDDLIDVSGGSDGGGTVYAYADGPVTVSSEIKANSRNFGGEGGTVLLSSGQQVTLAKTAIVNVNGHDTTLAGDDGEGGTVVLQGCQVEVVDDASAGANVTAVGSVGGAIYIEGSNTPLVSPATSVRVGDKSLLDSSGSGAAGEVLLNVAERRLGLCSNNHNASCQVNSECVFGCGNVGTCDYQIPNPDTQGTIAQFQPAPVFQQSSSGLIPCANTCN